MTDPTGSPVPEQRKRRGSMNRVVALAIVASLATISVPVSANPTVNMPSGPAAQAILRWFTTDRSLGCSDSACTLIDSSASFEVYYGDLSGGGPKADALAFVSYGPYLLVFRPVGAFMGEGRVIAFRVPEGLEGRHLHAVGLDGIERPVSTMPDVGSGRGKEALGVRNALHGVERWGGGCREVRREVVDLLGVKHGVALEERNFALGLVSLLRGLGAGDLAREHDKLAMLSLADLRPAFLRLFVGQPYRAGVTARGCRHPKRNDVDATVGDSIMPQRARDASGGVFCVPRFQPRAGSALKLGDNPVGDPGVEVCLFHDLLSFRVEVRRV